LAYLQQPLEEDELIAGDSYRSTGPGECRGNCRKPPALARDSTLLLLTERRSTRARKSKISLKNPFFGSLLDDAENGILPHIFNPGHTKPDLAIFIHHKMLIALVDVGTQNIDAHPLAFLD
jgi:hypothetical protein